MLEKKPSKPRKGVAKKRELFSRKPFFGHPNDQKPGDHTTEPFDPYRPRKKKNGKVGDHFK